MMSFILSRNCVDIKIKQGNLRSLEQNERKRVCVCMKAITQKAQNIKPRICKLIDTFANEFICTYLAYTFVDSLAYTQMVRKCAQTH